MIKKPDYAILAAHGSGINALCGFMNMQPETACFKAREGVNATDIHAFFSAPAKDRQGFVIDSVHYEEMGILNDLLSAGARLLIVLTRDPLSRLKSVINTHIQWYANSASGFFERDVKDVLLYQHGDVENFISFMLLSHNMNTAALLFPRIKSHFDEILFFDVSALSPQNVLETVNLIREKLGLSPLNALKSPASRVFSRENTFVRDIRRLKLTLGDETFLLKPWPADHLGILQKNPQDSIFEADPSEYGFNVGEFCGDIYFLADGKQPETAQKKALRKLLADNPEILKTYCGELSRRQQLARAIAGALFVTDDNLLTICRKNPGAGAVVKDFIIRQQEELFGFQNDAWRDSKEFLRRLDSVSHANAVG